MHPSCRGKKAAEETEVTGSATRQGVDVAENPLATVSFAGLDVRPVDVAERPASFHAATPEERAAILRGEDAGFRADFAATTAATLQPNAQGLFEWNGRQYTSRDAAQRAIAITGPIGSTSVTATQSTAASSRPSA